MATRKKKLGVSKGELDKFIIKDARKYLPRVKASTSESSKIFSSLVKTAISQIASLSRQSAGQSGDSGTADFGNLSNNSVNSSLFNNLLKGLTTPGSSTNQSAPLFRQSRSQIAADALKSISLGKKNL